MLQVVNHGGHCCGVKHIFGFPGSPAENTPALPSAPVFQGAFAEMKPGTRFYPGPEPIEPGGERLDKLIAYIDKLKPQHLTEAILTKYLLPRWQVFMEERGFKLITPDGFKNSNTSSTLFVFHRVTPLSPEMKAKQDERIMEAAKKAAAKAAKEVKEPKPTKKAAAPLRAPRSSIGCGDPDCRLCNQI